jgi:hypothetical protein
MHVLSDGLTTSMTYLWALLKRRIAELICALDPPRGRHRAGPEPDNQGTGDETSQRSRP